MKYVLLAILFFIVGVALTQVERPEQAYIPIVRVRTESGLFTTVIQSVTPRRAVCATAVEDLITEMTNACPGCFLESSECSTELSGMDRALASGQALPVYTVSADGVRIAMIGPPPTVQSQCRTMAAAMVEKGLKTATCVFPQFQQTDGGKRMGAPVVSK